MSLSLAVSLMIEIVVISLIFFVISKPENQSMRTLRMTKSEGFLFVEVRNSTAFTFQEGLNGFSFIVYTIFNFY